MNVLFDNVNFESSSGPNQFGRKLAKSIVTLGHNVTDTSDHADVQLSFISITRKMLPTVLRLDGIYFNTVQDWERLNEPIQRSYELAEAVVTQSRFNAKLIEKYFGIHKNMCTIPNGTDMTLINNIPKLSHPEFRGYSDIWCCASSWRSHKRLKDNVRYFLENANSDTCLIVAGNNPDYTIDHERVYYAGNLDWKTLISLYKASSIFIHLAWLDHCPNVVVDARASGCKIVCSSTGGTKEIAGTDAIIIEEEEWDYEPTMLYEPPELDFNRVNKMGCDSNLDIILCTNKYLGVLESLQKPVQDFKVFKR